MWEIRLGGIPKMAIMPCMALGSLFYWGPTRPYPAGRVRKRIHRNKHPAPLLPGFQHHPRSTTAVFHATCWLVCRIKKLEWVGKSIKCSWLSQSLFQNSPQCNTNDSLSECARLGPHRCKVHVDRHEPLTGTPGSTVNRSHCFSQRAVPCIERAL